MTGWIGFEGAGLDRILELLSSSDITFFKVRKGDVEIVVSRDGARRPPDDPAAPHDAAIRRDQDAQAPGVADGQAVPGPERGEPPHSAPDPSVVPVTAPIPGFFYHSPRPGAPPFAAVGTPVTEQSTVGLIESMKVFVEVRAGVAGVVAEVLAEDGALVRQDQPLVCIRPGAAGPEETS